MEDRKIRVAITHGDTNGIGYELIFKTFAEPEMLELCTPIIYGSPKIAAYHRKAMDMQANFSIINRAEDAQDGRVNLLTCFDDEVKVELGVPTKESGTAALKALDRAMTDFRSQLYDVLVACPALPTSLSTDNYTYNGLKEYAETSIGDGAKAIRIMINESMRIALATDRLAVKDIAGSLTEEYLLSKIRQLHTTLKRDFRLSNPRIGVLALNPNADGAEDNDIIKPAIGKAAEEGINAYGPFAAEKYFGDNLFDAFDCTLAMYDDQGIIPFNTLMQNDGIYYIASLPMVCTAPALTPNFDDAGKCVCDESALRHAIYAAIDIIRHRDEYDEPMANPLPKLYHERRDESEKVRFSIPKKREQGKGDRRQQTYSDRKGNAPERNAHADKQTNGDKPAANEKPTVSEKPVANEKPAVSEKQQSEGVQTGTAENTTSAE